MLDRATGRGVGKLILCGEHAVVYGHPALAFAVNRGMTVTLTRHDGPLALTNDFVGDPRLLPALATVLPAGVRVQITSDLPIGRGMGSSAALAVATVRAWAELTGAAPPSAEDIFTQAMPIEREFHGNPSGLDVAISARGGFIRYRRSDPPEIETIHASIPWHVVVLDSGSPGDTAALVAGVAARRPTIDPILQRIGDLVSDAERCLENTDALGEVLTENHGLLCKIGVSTEQLDALVNLALDHGASGAKLAGAGGGGVVLAVTNDPSRLVQAAHQHHIGAFHCRVQDVP